MNHLMIGLGGTGGRVLRALRKSTYRAFRDAEPSGLVLDYLFVDSDPKSFVDDDPNWTVLGRSVQLPKRSQMLIAQANLPAIVDDLNAHPNLKPWLGDRAAWGEILASLNIDAAGGQKRRLGRFLFAMSARRFRDSVTRIVQDMQERGSRSADVTFHIFCGLAGGTGSGALIDVIAQIRSMYPDQTTKRILVYAYLPDLNPPARWNTGNYHANAYAALLELNAMSAGAWAPFDVVNGQGPVSNPGGFWFNGAYVFTDENDQGYRAAIDRDLPEILADFVFHKTVVARSVAWDGLVRTENSENGDASPETSPGSKVGQRSVRFMSFGIRRVAFPEETIREQLTYDFEVQALRQLAFNNWQDGVGYLEQPKPRADAEFVADRKQREDWRLTDEHLRLQRPIIDTEGSRRWRTYAEEWEAWETNYVGLAEQAERARWLNELKTLFAGAWSSNFRGVGVPQFFETAGRDRRNLAGAIRGRVEQSLFEDWRNGVRAIAECGRVVDALMTDLDGRLNGVTDYVQKREASADDLQRQLMEVEKRWDGLRLIPGSREREMTKAGLLLREHYAARTLAEAARFSKSLIEELRSQFAELKGSIDQAQRVVGEASDQALKRVQARASAIEQMGAPSGYVTTVGDAKQVAATRRKLVLNEEEQRTHTARLRGKIVEVLGQTPTFAVFSRRFAEADVRNALLSTSAEDVASAHQRLVTERSERVIGVSVIDKLRDQWGEDQERLNREAAALARGAGRFVSFDEAEVNKSYPGKGPAPRGVETFAVILPTPPDQKDFVDKLERAFRNARPGGEVDFVRAGDQTDEIALVTLVNLFPLRFVRLTRALRDRYNARLADAGRARGVLEVHTEGDGTQFPDLFVADRASVAGKLRPVLLTAVVLGAVTAGRNRTTGREQLLLLRRDEDGFDLDPLVLGSGLGDAAENLGEGDYYTLRETVAGALAQGRLVNDADRTVARDGIAAAVDKVRGDRGGDPTDPETAAWSAAAREAMKIIRREREP